jgi:hypothetical protein
MTDPSYPTDISDCEAELGYQLIQVYATIGFCFERSLFWVHVVAKVLGESDIIVKRTFGGDPVYIHKRFGKFSSPFSAQLKNQKSEWHSISTGFQKDPQQAIYDAKFEADVSLKIPIAQDKAEIRIG